MSRHHLQLEPVAGRLLVDADEAGPRRGQPVARAELYDGRLHRLGRNVGVGVVEFLQVLWSMLKAFFEEISFEN